MGLDNIEMASQANNNSTKLEIFAEVVLKMPPHVLRMLDDMTYLRQYGYPRGSRRGGGGGSGGGGKGGGGSGGGGGRVSDSGENDDGGSNDDGGGD